jgi:proteasome accessory factor B
VERLDRLERLANLVLLLLDTAVPLSASEIMDTIGGYPEGEDARRRAFERDKEVLRAEGIPVEAVPRSGPEQFGYRIRPENYYLPDLGLTPEEQVALNLAVAGVHLGEASAGRPLLGVGLAAPAPSAPLALLPSAPALGRLYRAVADRAVVRFHYRGRLREVEPYGLGTRAGRWYLVGFDRDRQAVRTFRVDRVEAPIDQRNTGSVVRPAGFDVAAALPAEPWAFGEGAATLVDVALDEMVFASVVTELGPEAVSSREALDRHGGGGVVRLAVVNEEAFYAWLFGLLEHAVVLGPPEFRTGAIARLEALAGPTSTWEETSEDGSVVTRSTTAGSEEADGGR